ncbi:hypothetical protein Ddye_013424 [Dipteronia dyeriana]|uniref:Pectinesterase inhibitor domain-containing protein n=1 Tax=Dipteronia dyeriana TaxID=168575 RepID=A0AAD9X676_9ROSI|nr:hypothetical protein Ddye_013424 [Dipteronia dyeriana]
MESFTCSKLISCHSLATIITLLYFCTIATTMCLTAGLLEQRMIKSNASDFIKTSCGVARYPDICYETLSSYARIIQTSPKEFANAALSVSLKEVQPTSASVLKLSKGHDLRPREVGAVKDCVENMRDSIHELQQSLIAMKDLVHYLGPEFEFQMSNVMTWVSAALTNEDTCMDNFEGNGFNGEVKSTGRGYVSQLTSNALDFSEALEQNLKNRSIVKV